MSENNNLNINPVEEIKDLKNEIILLKGTVTKLIDDEVMFYTIFNSAPYVITTSNLEDGKFIDINKAFTSILGYTKEEALSNSSIGMKLWVNESDRQQIVSSLKASKVVVEQEYLFRSKKGEMLTGLMSAQIIQIKGKPSIFCTIADITKLKKIEDDLKISENRYHQIFDNLIDLYYQTDMHGIIISLSPSSFTLSGWMPEELLGHNVLELYPKPEQRKTLLEEIQLKGMVYNHEIELLHKDGKILSISVSSHLIKDEKGNPKYIEGMIRDITREKQAEMVLLEKTQQTEKINKLMIGRELEMIKLKKELTNLKNKHENTR